MIKRARCAYQRSWRYSAVVALSASMVACGGSSGTTNTDTGTDDNFDFETSDFDGDLDGDGILDSLDSDADGDGVLDSVDNFVDLDQDGRDDGTFLTESESLAGGDSNLNNLTEDLPCGIEDGTVAFGEEADWSDNCQIRRSINGGEFADSLYAVGIQRIVYCSAVEGTFTQSLEVFADGEYGPATEAAVQVFQASSPNPLTDDGIVGGETWGKLQDSLERLDLGLLSPSQTVTFDTFGFSTGPCAGQPLFYQTVTQDAETSVFVEEGWRLAKNEPNSDETVPFSIELPFGRLD